MKKESNMLPITLPCKPKQRYLILLLTSSIVFWFKLVFLNKTIFFDLTTRYFYPVSAVLSEAVKNFALPFWNPYIYCGMPFLANPQNAVFYPLSYLFVEPKMAAAKRAVRV